MTRKKEIIIFLIFVIIIAICGRYYQLNGTLGINNQFTKVVYNIGEKVNFENNICLGGETYDGYSAKIEDINIYDFEVFLDKYNVTKEQIESTISEKIAEVSITLYNEECKNNHGISFSGFFLLGVDWYTTINEELIRYANPFFHDAESARGIIIPNNSCYTIKLIYNLSKDTFTSYNWNNILSEDMWIELTINPQNKYIKVQ